MMLWHGHRLFLLLMYFSCTAQASISFRGQRVRVSGRTSLGATLQVTPNSSEAKHIFFREQCFKKQFTVTLAHVFHRFSLINYKSELIKREEKRCWPFPYKEFLRQYSMKGNSNTITMRYTSAPHAAKKCSTLK